MRLPIMLGSVLFTTSLFLASGLSAQATTVKPNAPIRFTSESATGGPVSSYGRFQRISGDTLFYVNRVLTDRMIPLADITSLEVNHQGRRNGGKGLLIGVAAAGLLTLGYANSDCKAASECYTVLVGPLFGVLFGGAGFLIGSFVRSSNWEPVQF